MPANLTGLTTISRQPSLRDYDPNRLHAFSLSSILHFSSQNETTLSDVLGDRPLAVHQDEQFGDSSFTILLYDAKSEKIKELVFSAEEDFDSSVLNILEPVEALVQEKVASHRTFDFEAGAHYCDPHLCETSLRCVLAQGNSNANLSERLKMLEDIKRAFSLPESTFEDVKTRAIEGTHCRLAEVQAQLKALEEDKGWALRPDQFENAALYKKCKSDNIKALLDVEALLQSLSPFSGEIQVSILSADKIANGVTRCSRARACYKWDMLPFVYCTIKVTNANSKLDAGEDMNINYITKEAAFLDHVEWQEKSRWISINSLDDHVCIKMWQRNSHTQLSKAYRDLHLLSMIRSASYRWTKIASNEDILLGQVVFPMTKIESQISSSGMICGSIPSKLYTLRDGQGERSMFVIQVELAFRCELLCRGPSLEKNLLNPPVEDLEAAYDGLVEVAFGTLLEGEFEIGEPWSSILFCVKNYYCLRQERCCLAVLKHMAKLFEPQVGYLVTVLQAWRPICKAAKEEQLSKGELLLHAQIVSLLFKPCINAIEDFQTLFHQCPPNGAISKLIELISLLLTWEPNASGIMPCLRRWVKVSCVQRFEKLLSDNSDEGKITSKTFSVAISLLRKDFEMLNTLFQKEFPAEMDLFCICTAEFYKLISQYINGIVGSVRFCSEDFEELTKELSLFHVELERREIGLELIDLHSLLKDFILDLIASIKPRMIDWIISSINDERWEPISTQTGAFFSFSIVDLYFMINGVVENMTTRLSYFRFGKLYYPKIEDCICKILETYLQVIEKLCLQELPDNFDEERHQLLSHYKIAHNAQKACVSKALCVKLNNFQALLQQQTILEATLLAKWESFSYDTTVGSMNLRKNYQSGDIKRTEKNNVDDSFSEERVGQRFEVLKSLAKQSLSNVMGLIVECMQHGFTKRLQKIMDDCSTEEPDALHIDDLELLTSYLDDHLKVLNEFLNPEIFRCLLLEIVGALIFCMEEFALNRDEDQHPMTAKQRIHLEEALNLFYDYFYGDGVGVSKDQMDNLSLRLRKILACSDLLTRDLCNLYWKAWDKLSAKEDATCESEEDAELHVLDFLLLLQQRDDDEARIIAANQKLMAKKRMLQTQYSSEKESLSKTHFEMPREVIRGVSQYLKAIPMQFPSLNVSCSAFQMVKKW